ncbi:MAG: DHH family phosphoesterase [Bacilli bacterium]|nr:DHH family phosphoesterase [Bacilli bacterium]
MIILTVGKSYIDIDGYASAIAYKELLNMQNIEAKFVSNAVLNYSITKSLLDISYSTDNYKIDDSDKFIILDLSNKEYFPDFVKEDNIIEIIDHHSGYKEYWDNKLGNKSEIEEIGSVATIIVEKYEESNLLNRMNTDIAKLLMSAILDNTLNFTATITKERDKIAYKKLEDITKDYNYKEKYFLECQKYIESNLEESIKNDIKIQHINEYLPDVFGQLTIYNANELLNKKDELIQIMNTYGKEWILNLISLKDNTSYILYSDETIRNNLEKVLNYSNENNIVIIKPAMLRKEIMKKTIN